MRIRFRKPENIEFTKEVNINKVENYNPNAKVVNNNYFAQRGFHFELTSFFSTLKSQLFH